MIHQRAERREGEEAAALPSPDMLIQAVQCARRQATRTMKVMGASSESLSVVANSASSTSAEKLALIDQECEVLEWAMDMCNEYLAISTKRQCGREVPQSRQVERRPARRLPCCSTGCSRLEVKRKGIYIIRAISVRLLLTSQPSQLVTELGAAP